MAITWEVKINVLDVPTKTVSVTATRTDDADPDNQQVCSVLSAVIATAAQKTAVLDELWAQHLALDQRAIAISNFVGNLETAAKDNLEARE